MTLSTPMPASNWPSSRPDGPEPMMATCVRISSPSRCRCRPVSSPASRKRGGGRHHHLRQQQPLERPGRARALLLVDQRLVHAGKLGGIEARQRHQHLGRHRILLVRHGRRAAAAGERDLARRPAPSARRPGRTCRGCRSRATASWRTRRGCRAGCAIAARRQGRAVRRAPRAPPVRPCRRACPACRPRRRTARPAAAGDLLAKPLPVPLQRLPPRRDAVGDR